MSEDCPLDQAKAANDEEEGALDLGNITLETDGKSGCPDMNIFKKFSRRSVMSFCAKTMAFTTPICAYSMFLILPYYVIATPEYGWSATNLALFYSFHSIGETVGSQVVPIAAVLDSNNALFAGHMTQMLFPFLGYFCMSPMLPFNKWLFAVGMFSCGFSNGLSAIQAYCTEIADGDEDFEVNLMSQLGQLNILCNLVSSFVLPAIYDTMGFQFYCATMMFIVFGMLCSLLVLVVCLKAREAEYKPSYHSFTPDGEDDAYSVDDEDRSSVADVSLKSLEKHVQLEMTAIPITRYLSPSLYMLLLLKVAQSFYAQVYCIAYPVVFAQDFGISPSVGGILFGSCALIGVFGIAVSTKIASFMTTWEYPYDVTIFFTLAGVSSMSYVLFYQKWIAYSFHLLGMGSMFALHGMEMTCRLFLCPSQAFQQVTGIVGVIQATMYLLAAFMAPLFFSISDRFPFLVMTVLAFTAAVGTMCVYACRQRVLNQNFSGMKIKGNRGYLAKERAYYAMVHQSSSRRGAILSDEARVGLVDDIQDQLKDLQNEFASRRGFLFLLNPMAASRMEQFANNAAARGEMRKSQMMKSESGDQRPGYNPNALIQLDELKEMNVDLDQDQDQDHGDDIDPDDDESGSIMLSGLAMDSDKEQSANLRIPAKDVQNENARNSMTVNAVNKGKQFRDPKLSFIGCAGPAAKYTSTTTRKSVVMRNSIYKVAVEECPKRKTKKRGRMSIARKSMFRTCEPSIALGGNLGAMDGEHEAVRRAKAIQNSRKSLFMTAMGR